MPVEPWIAPVYPLELELELSPPVPVPVPVPESVPVPVPVPVSEAVMSVVPKVSVAGLPYAGSEPGPGPLVGPGPTSPVDTSTPLVDVPIADVPGFVEELPVSPLPSVSLVSSPAGQPASVNPMSTAPAVRPTTPPRIDAPQCGQRESTTFTCAEQAPQTTKFSAMGAG